VYPVLVIKKEFNNYGPKNDGKNRDSKGRFKPGHSGGPGRKPGEPSKIARALRAQWSERNIAKPPTNSATSSMRKR
jgi:hypothetical protein